MKALFVAPLALNFLALLCAPTTLVAAEMKNASQDPAGSTKVGVWTSAKAEHVYGFPEIKPNKKGTLTLSADSLTFTGKSGNTSIPRSAVTAVSAGNERVEMWGMTGRIMRMTIPDGGGIAAAAFMHHRIDMLTVEFNDAHGGSHGAVFFLPANEAARALQSFALATVPVRATSKAACQGAAIDAKSVLVLAPIWDRAEVPAAYRSLVYEHVIDRLRRSKEVAHVYREGEPTELTGCPQYVVQISIASFKEGSSVKRAFMGPVGMFVGTTQMKFDVTFTDASGVMSSDEQIAATIRGESESTGVADHVAKNIAKHYAKALKNADKSSSAKKPNTMS
jgi:hypothetical protein